jgi:hypothetical protein
MRRHPRALGERERPESFKRPGDSALRVHSNSLSLNLAMPPAHPRQSAGICMHRAKTRAPWRRRARCARGQPPGLRLAAAAAANDGAAAVLPVSFARAGSCRVQPSLSHSRGGGAGGGQSQDHPQGPRPEARRLCLSHARLSASRFSLVHSQGGRGLNSPGIGALFGSEPAASAPSALLQAAAAACCKAC